MGTRRCTATTKRGRPCSRAPIHGGEYCLAHDKEARESRGFGGPQPGSGRPRAPRVVEVVRDRVEAQAEKILAVYLDALEADRGVTVGSGDTAELELLPDHAVRLKAAEALLDRAYGRPSQQVAVGGPDGSAVPVAFDPRLADAAHAFLAKVRQTRGA